MGIKVSAGTDDLVRVSQKSSVSRVIPTQILSQISTKRSNSWSLNADFLLWKVKNRKRGDTPAITSATKISAETTGFQHEYGTIQVGKVADMVVLREDPTLDITNTRKIAFVVKSGDMY